jgi:hypothetical protein
MRASRPVIGTVFVVAFAAAMLAAGLACAGTRTSDECAEGAEFIGNAARARENGMSREAFLEQMQADFQAIRAFPNELRWFVHDEADETFLLGAAREVFDRPEIPERHRTSFFRACLGRLMV